MKKARLLPKRKKLIEYLGENLRLARLRRGITMEMAAERANISRTTLWKLERGEANVRLESLVQVLSIYGLQEDILLLGRDDELGRKLQDIELLK
ncbi:MAG: helix-turn-helix transcriptional regulator [Bacteroidota bacterium]